MTPRDLDELSVEELWALRERIAVDLASRLIAEKTKLELRLKEIRGGYGKQSEATKERRPYPKVFPKFRNPDRPSISWFRLSEPGREALPPLPFFLRGG